MDFNIVFYIISHIIDTLRHRTTTEWLVFFAKCAPRAHESSIIEVSAFPENICLKDFPVSFQYRIILFVDEVRDRFHLNVEPSWHRCPIFVRYGLFNDLFTDVLIDVHQNVSLIVPGGAPF